MRPTRPTRARQPARARRPTRATLSGDPARTSADRSRSCRIRWRSMLPDRPRLGIHLALAAGMIRAADRAAELGLGTVQVFADNPTAWRRRFEPAPELPAFRERLAAVGIDPVVIHASYLVNPAGAHPLNRERSIELLTSELRAAEDFGASLVNVHIGSHGGAGVDAGIAAVVDLVRRARDTALESGRVLPAIVLENSAGGGFGLGLDIVELGAIA